MPKGYRLEFLFCKITDICNITSYDVPFMRYQVTVMVTEGYR